MKNDAVTEWTLDGVLAELAQIHETMNDRQFAFILGAGASFTSGIPTGYNLAQRWLRDLHLRECIDQRPLPEWIENCGIGKGSLTLETAGEHYPHIFERRFENDREAGYAELEAAMEGKSPSLGYSLLAEIIQHTRHKVVVTTNFDNLVADALAMHAHQSPLVVAHESLAGFVRPQLRRPLVAKIHRDLFLHPINDAAGVSTMEQGWKIALKKLFQYFTPIVVGYGGNDGSLMNMLEELDRGDIAGRMLWCYREGAPPPEKALTVLKKHSGVTVKIAGFDEFMLQLAAKLVKGFDVAAIAERTAKLGSARADRYREQAKRLMENSAQGTVAEQKAGEVLSESLRSGSSWWAWEMKAQAATSIEERNRLYIDGLINFPKSAELTGNYAIYLEAQRKDYDSAEKMYKKALELDPSNANNTGNYANFLAGQRKDNARAEVMYKKALELDPSSANNIGNYANFLAGQRKNDNLALAMFSKSLELDPDNAIITSNYASFLANQRKDYDRAEAMYKKALGIAPINVTIIGNYANFLADQRRDYDGAEAMYKKALEIAPGNATIIGNYASFLADLRKDYGGGETLYKKALEIDPSNSHIIGHYANFLKNQRKDYIGAEAAYRKALEIDPSNANIIGNYANFLRNQRKDYDGAEAAYKKALEINPTSAHITGNYASFLADLRKDYDSAEDMHKKSLEFDSNNANNTANYARFLESQRKDYNNAEAMYKKALELDPRNATITDSYAIFLANQRRDYSNAEAMHKKALELDPSNANITGNYAYFLANKRKDYNSAEAMYKKALKLDPSNANVTGNYAIFLAHQRGDNNDAEAMYKKALELDPSNANNMVNYASALLTRGDEASVKTALSLVKDVLENLRPNVSQIVAEALLYGALVQELVPTDDNKNMLARLKGTLLANYPRLGWNFSPMFESVLPKIPVQRQALFQMLGEAILNEERVQTLDVIEAWHEIQAIDPFAV